MSRFKKNHESALDRAVAQVANEPLDPRVIAGAASRVWERLSRQAPEATAPDSPPASVQPVSGSSGSLRTCDDYQRLIPAHLAGELSPARSLLLEDHTRSCIACRRALRQAQTGVAAALPAAVRRGGRSQAWWTSLAAVLALALGFGLFALYQQLPAAGQQARVESIEGSLYRVASQTTVPLGAGDRVSQGDEIRTAKGSRALVRLADGSRIEMSERAGLSYDVRHGGTTINLGQGRIIVQAAKQHQKHLYVSTSDCLVSVTGTIFAVNHGTKGSRVSVVEGEVRVKQARMDSILHPGDQVTTRASVAGVPVRQEIAWSRDAQRYDALLTELANLGREVDSQVARPGLRYSTRLLDLAPADTLAFVALPNVAASLADTQRLLDAKLADNQVLRQWWEETMATGDRAARFHDVIEQIGSLGRYLGPELAVAVTPDGPVVLAEVTNPGAFHASLEQEVASFNGRQGRPGKTSLRLVADSSAAGNAAGNGLLLWTHGDLFIAAVKADRLAKMGVILDHPEANPFRQTAFHDKVASAYKDGAGWLFSGDLKALLKQGGAAPSPQAEALGILDLDHFIVDRHEGDGRSETRAALTFDRPRRGLASWLAAPAPMGALDFISPDANLAASFVVKNPVSLLDELLASMPEFGQELAKLESEHGFNLHDLAAPLGGEIAFAVDGPLLPTPSWKLVAEVYDPAALERSFEQMASRLNDSLKAEGKPGVTLANAAAEGRTYYTLTSEEPKLEIDYVFVDGYLVAAPSRALLDRAIQQRASGYTLASSSKFQSLLPADKQLNFSALFYSNLGSSLAPLAGIAGRMASAQKSLAPAGASGGNTAGASQAPSLAALSRSGPTLVYAYAEEDRILFASSSETSPLGMNMGMLAGFGHLIGMMDAAGHGATSQAGAGE
ncbi:MAG TPA: FecR domain-containing protein [Thermoanaerobaculia bacterium]|nr:FecR domain-containing protein [Thermoanaerobaculia bacterium]